MLSNGMGNVEMLTHYRFSAMLNWIMEKLDLHDKSELIKYAIRKGLITVEP